MIGWPLFLFIYIKKRTEYINSNFFFKIINQYIFIKSTAGLWGGTKSTTLTYFYVCWLYCTLLDVMMHFIYTSTLGKGTSFHCLINGNHQLYWNVIYSFYFILYEYPFYMLTLHFLKPFNVSLANHSTVWFSRRFTGVIAVYDLLFEITIQFEK